MQLQDVLFGVWTPPEVTATRTHKIGFHAIPRYVAPPVKVHKPKGQPESEIMLEKIMKKLPEPMTPMDICLKTPWTRNHCGMLLCKLWKAGKLKRQKVIVQQSRTYLYSWCGEQNEA